MTGRRVIRDPHDGEPLTLRDVGPIDPATGCGGCGQPDCWACRAAAAFRDEFAARIACPGCSTHLVEDELCEHRNPLCIGCCAAEHLEAPRLREDDVA